MILEFAIQNFKSFKELQVFSLEASNEEEDNDNILRVINAKGNYRVLKTKAIYGANAAGKSNLILGLVAMWKILDNNLKYNEVFQNFVAPYRLDSELVKKPTYFQIIFTHDGNRYRYGFEVDKDKVHSEWLYLKREKEVVLFEREGIDIIELNETSFKEGKIIKQGKGIKMFTNRTLVISVLDQLSSPISSIVKESINEKIIISPNLPSQYRHDNNWFMQAMHQFEEDSVFQKWTIQLLHEIDDSITNSKIQEIVLPDGQVDKIPVIIRTIEGYDIPFMLETEEASGTKKIFDYSSIIYRSIKEGKALIIDEMDALLHPKLTRKIIELFQSPEAHKDAQLIFATHDTNLMDNELLRRDQITFIEKSKEGHSEIFDLSDIKGVRAKDLFEKNYLKGNYGALPTLNNLEKILLNG
jgi:AAA15 family ATPase/GTPase